MDDATIRAARALAFEAWVEGREVRPEQELLGEHYVMERAIAAMDLEARRLLDGSQLRPDFWETVVSVIGDFIHRVHRRKEEEVFFPALAAWGVIEEQRTTALERSHRTLGGWTGELAECVAAADWEGVFRTVALYLGEIRSHLTAEEQALLSPDLAAIPSARMAPLSERFREIEREALGETGRAGVLALTERLCRQIDMAELHREIDAW